MSTNRKLHIVSDTDRLVEIVRLFDSGPDLIPVRDIDWLIDAARERNELRVAVEQKNESLVAAGRQFAATEEHWQAENGKLLVELTHRVGWEERCLRAEAEIRRLRALIDKHNDECRECPVIEA